MTDMDMKILLVDDFVTMRKILKNIFGQLGYKNISEADDGGTALTKLKQEKFDFLVSDWNMPKMSGLEFLKAVRSEEQLKGIPFLMVTAESLEQNIKEAIEAGITDYIVKPFTAAKMEEKIKKIFG